MNSIKIVADSSSDIFSLPSVPYSFAPLKIITREKEFVDNKNLNVKEMVDYLDKYKGKSSTSCPNCSDWLEAFGEAEEIFCVTITGTLSGSYNAALMAKEMYESKYPERKVCVINSLSAGPEIALIIEKIGELIEKGLSFEEIEKEITKYTEKTGLLFMLSSMKNLANNGRVSIVTAKMAGILGIRVVGKASDKGDLEPIAKCRGEKRAVERIIEALKEIGFKGGKLSIAHCFNEEAANELKKGIKAIYENACVKIYSCKGLCSFYAEMGGMLVGFEKG